MDSARDVWDLDPTVGAKAAPAVQPLPHVGAAQCNSPHSANSRPPDGELEPATPKVSAAHDAAEDPTPTAGDRVVQVRVVRRPAAGSVEGPTAVAQTLATPTLNLAHFNLKKPFHTSTPAAGPCPWHPLNITCCATTMPTSVIL